MPIFNQRDYRVAKARLAQLRGALGPEAIIDGLTASLSAEISEVRQEALRAEHERLRREIESYEELQDANEPKDLTGKDLGTIPIIARIARRLSQKELAELLDVSEQQIQRYESDRYASISAARYERLLDILGVELRPRLSPSWPKSAQGAIPTLEVDTAIVSALRKNSWMPMPKGITTDEAAQIVSTYVSENAFLSHGRTLYRRTAQAEPLAESALAIWQARVLQRAAVLRPKLRAKFNIVDTSWLGALAKLSSHPDGPAEALEFLKDKGILVVLVPHLPHTRLDGAAMLLSEGTPIVALTLRYDRLDSFWFTLLHEIGHVFLHFHNGLDAGFMDDLDVTNESPKEREADMFASSALIPDEVWEIAPARFSKSPELIVRMGASLEIHPAIIAGRIRKERADYKLFSNLLGNGSVRAALGNQLS